jgi:AcrR family transcriptional regulator
MRDHGAMTSAPRTARAVAREQLTRAILDSAGAQLTEVGPAALSVRAVARDLEMASSAVYRYFRSRDALLTALIVEAYDDLGDRVEEGTSSAPGDDLAGRWRTVASVVRDWARSQPHRYALVYGSPVPGYAAPEDTVAPARRVTQPMLELLRDAQQAGLVPAGPTDVPAEEAAGLAPVLEAVEPPLSPVWGVAGLTAWATLFGHVSLELFGHMHNAVLDPDAHFACLVDRTARDLGLA